MNDTNQTSNGLPRHILCALDADGRAEHAVAASVWLSEALGAAVEFVHAFPTRPILWGKQEQMAEWVAGTEATGRALREGLRTILARAPRELGLRTSADALRLFVKSGQPVHVILERARESGADLVVLGPHAKRGRFDFGSTARGVLAHAGAVWMQPEALRPVRRILAAVDFSSDSLRALSIARDLASVFGARVTALQAFDAPVFDAGSPGVPPIDHGYVINDLRKAEHAQFDAEIAAFDWRGVPHSTRFEDGEPVERILALQAEHDLVVMGTHGRTGLSAALLGSVAHSVLRGAHVPVLATRVQRDSYLI